MRVFKMLSLALILGGTLIFASCQKDIVSPINSDELIGNDDSSYEGLFRSETEYADIFIPEELLGDLNLPQTEIEEEGIFENSETGEIFVGTVRASFVEGGEGLLFTSFQVSGGLISVIGGQNPDVLTKWWDLYMDCAVSKGCAGYADPHLQAACYFGCAFTGLFDCINDPGCSLV